MRLELLIGQIFVISRSSSSSLNSLTICGDSIKFHMALSTLPPAIQLMSTTRKQFSSQPLPYVCKRCLAILTEEKKVKIPVKSIDSGSRISSDTNRPSKSKNSPSSLSIREPAFKRHMKDLSKAKRRPRAFTKCYDDFVSPKDVRDERSRGAFLRPLSLPQYKRLTLRASANDPEIRSLKDVANACANEVVRKLRDEKLKSIKEVCKS